MLCVEFNDLMFVIIFINVELFAFGFGLIFLWSLQKQDLGNI